MQRRGGGRRRGRGVSRREWRGNGLRSRLDELARSPGGRFSRGVVVARISQRAKAGGGGGGADGRPAGVCGHCKMLVLGCAWGQGQPLERRYLGLARPVRTGYLCVSCVPRRPGNDGTTREDRQPGPQPRINGFYGRRLVEKCIYYDALTFSAVERRVGAAMRDSYAVLATGSLRSRPAPVYKT